MEEALARAARGEQPAFGAIVREYERMVYSMAYHFFHNPALAEDLAQDVFLRLYQNLAAIKSPAHLMLWLRQVTSRRCIDQARRGAAQPSLNLEEAPELTVEGEPPDPLLAQRLRRTVASLPEDSRLVIILRYQEELELAEIAEILEIPINTVKSRLQRSLAALREKLSPAVEMSKHERP
jgi:RNA polymerase sigma-70 factor (ECF subfamily)